MLCLFLSLYGTYMSSRAPLKNPTLQNPAALRRLREKDGLSQSALAIKVGISSQHLCRLESGKSGATPAILKALAEALAVEKSAITRAPCECHVSEPAA